MDMWSMWSLSGVHMEYVESKWSPCGSVGECKIQYHSNIKFLLNYLGASVIVILHVWQAIKKLGAFSD